MNRAHHSLLVLSMSAVACACGTTRTPIHTRRDVDTTRGSLSDVSTVNGDGGGGRVGENGENADAQVANKPLVIPPGSFVYASSHTRSHVELQRPGEAPVRLTPTRGRDWPAFEGKPVVYGISPDERWTLVCMKGAGLFAVATDGSTAYKPLFLTQMCGHGHFSTDGRELMLNHESGSGVSRLEFDPFTPVPTVVLTSSDASTRVTKLVQAGDSWVYTLDLASGGSQLFVVPKGATEPRTVVPQVDDTEWTVERGLDDGHVVLRTPSALHVVSLEDGSALTIAPTVHLAASVDDGQRWVGVEQSDAVRQLLSFRTDGSEATSPVVVVPNYIEGAVFLPTTRRVVARTTEGLIHTAWDGLGQARVHSTTRAVTPMGVSLDERWVYGCHADQLQHLDLQAEAPQWLPVEGALPGLMPPLLTAHPSLKVHADRYWSCGTLHLPRAGGQHVSEVIAKGRVTVVSDNSANDALYARTPDGTSHQLTVAHETPINSAYLPKGADRVIYGLQSARLNGADQFAQRSFNEGSVLNLAMVIADVPVYFRPTDRAGWNDIVAPALHANETGLKVLARNVYPFYAPVAVEDDVILIYSSGIWLTPLDGTAPTLLLDREPTPHALDEEGPFPHVLVDEARTQAIAAIDGKLVAFALDGSEAMKPRVISEGLPETYHWPRAIVGNEVLFHTYVEPNPGCNSCLGVTTGAAWLIPLDYPKQTPREVDARALFIEPARDRGKVFAGPFVSNDNKWALSTKEERLELMPLPVGSGPSVPVVGPTPAHPLARAQGADFVLIHSDDRLWRVPLVPNEANIVHATPLTPQAKFTLDLEPHYWLNNNDALLLNARLDGFDATVRLSMHGDDATAWNVLAGGQAGSESQLAALSPDQTWFMFTRGAPARGLMRARFGETSVAVTEDSDTYERFVGWTH